MKFDDQTLKKILIAAFVIIVLGFIIVKFWQKSYYSYPNTSEDNEYSVSAIATTTPATTPVSFTITTTAAHTIKVGDLITLSGLPTTGFTFTPSDAVPTTIDGLTPVFVVSQVGGTTIQVNGTVTIPATPNYTNIKVKAVGKGLMDTLKQALATCQDTYAQALISNPNSTTAVSDRTTCIATAVRTYTRGHCKWLPQGTTPAATPTSGPELTAYNNYQADIQKIQSAYASAYNRAQAGTFTSISDTQKATTIVSAARTADISNATKKYIASVCPGFYQPGNPTTPDPSSTYKAWTADITSASRPAATAAAPIFWAIPPVAGNAATGVTDAQILTWAQYARPVTFTTGAGLTATTGHLSGLTITGYTDKSGLGTTGNENWRKAYNAGPGTYPAPTWTTA